MWSDFRYRLRALVRRDDVERELSDELRFHHERQVAKLVAQGMSREEAERHSVAAVPERKQVPGVSAVAADVGQAVGRRGEQSLPGVLRSQVARRWVEIDEIGGQFCRPPP